MKLIWVTPVLLGVMGCSSLGGGRLDFLEALEEGAYDTAAEQLSSYCKKVTAVDSPTLAEERIEVRREIRQRGDNGPGSVDVPFLDEQTSRGEGPVIRIWCEGETVPEEIWKDYVKLF